MLPLLTAIHHVFYWDRTSTQTLWAIPVMQDNYIWALSTARLQQDADVLRTAVIVDPAVADPVLAWADQFGYTIEGILITHRHADHIGGVAGINESLKKTRSTPLPVWGPSVCCPVNRPVREGDMIDIPSLKLELSIVETPGHTDEHMVYLNADWLFCGDLLFSSGCGRPFDGTPMQLFDSIQRLAKTCIQQSFDPILCPAHEYTMKNLEFCLSVLPDHPTLQSQQRVVESCRYQNLPSLPVRFSDELMINPFLALPYFGDNHQQEIENGQQGKAIKKQ